MRILKATHVIFIAQGETCKVIIAQVGIYTTIRVLHSHAIALAIEETLV